MGKSHVFSFLHNETGRECEKPGLYFMYLVC